VEILATSATLARLGCDVAQGYAIAHPMPVEEFLGWLVAAESGLVDETLVPELSRGPAPA
jgi:EAL domain-containing protein (putative c-di-GMP-specific phosphodiesterase class I)